MRIRKGKFNVNKLQVGDLVRVFYHGSFINAEIAGISENVFTLKIPVYYGGNTKYELVDRKKDELYDSNMIFEK